MCYFHQKLPLIIFYPKSYIECNEIIKNVDLFLICFLHRIDKVHNYNVNLLINFSMKTYEPRPEKTGFLHMRIQRRRSASRSPRS